MTKLRWGFVSEKIELDDLLSLLVKWIWLIFGCTGADNRQDDAKIG
jgi:hypothetical protein